ncbi:MAG: antibiotic biosynthesis monooxygenase [Desulfurococcales archaeon]|nr:antibiotic biosynthesis monooxygenase [Desulfurococcales archaeon]MCE4605084.1 antibiotic biosynthesis monooxygenase [Desulfurococcales archaeon]
MPIAIINYIRANSPDAFEKVVNAFKNRAGLVEDSPGFMGLQVLANRERLEVLVITTWESTEAYEAWVNSKRFKEAHSRARSSGSGSSSEGVLYEVVDHVCRC